MSTGAGSAAWVIRGRIVPPPPSPPPGNVAA